MSPGSEPGNTWLLCWPFHLQMEGAVDELRARNAQLETVFDQNNAAIAQMQAEHGAARKVSVVGC